MNKEQANAVLGAYGVEDDGATLKSELSKLIEGNLITKEQANEMLKSYAFEDDGATLKELLSPLVSENPQLLNSVQNPLYTHSGTQTSTNSGSLRLFKTSFQA